MTYQILTERDARVFFSLIVEPGDSSVREFVNKFGSWETAARALADGTGPIPEEWHARVTGGTGLEVTLRQMHRLGITVLIPSDPQWPDQIERLGDATPFILYCRGNADLLRTPSVAVVGARAATGYGEHVTMELSGALADRGITVVSGAAYGIDGMAHRAALASRGGTIAVLAGGVDRFYPAGHDALLTRIVEAGLVISELPPGAAPTRWRFLQRNRIIAALSNALVVVEAGYRSGSLNAAGHALSVGVPLGAVPGPVTSATSAGCHKLIREGAALITGVDEVLELAGLSVTEPVPA
jgi:DNA processing protein